MIKEDCFAYGEDLRHRFKCRATTNKNCANCVFYKTKERFEEDRKKYPVRYDWVKKSGDENDGVPME